MSTTTQEMLTITKCRKRYDGYDINATAGSRTAQNFDLLNGMVLQENPYDHNSLLPSGGREGSIFSVPTLGQLGQYGIVEEPGYDTNIQKGVVANLRQGGPVSVITKADGCNALVVIPNGKTITKGVTRFFPGTDAKLYRDPTTGPHGIVANVVAASTGLTATGAFDNATATLPANSVNAGDIFDIEVGGLISASSSGVVSVSIKIGSSVLLVSGAPTAVTGDMFYAKVTLAIRTIGASGTHVSKGYSFVGTAAAAAGAADIPAVGGLASTAIDTTADMVITATMTLASGTATVNSDFFRVTRVATKTRVVAVAQETYTATADTSRLTRVRFNGEGIQ